jgi:hypothetical protein
VPSTDTWSLCVISRGPSCNCADGYLDMQLLRNPRMTLYLRDGPFFDDETGEMDYHAGCWCQSLACRHVMQTSSLTLQGMFTKCQPGRPPMSHSGFAAFWSGDLLDPKVEARLRTVVQALVDWTKQLQRPAA